MSFVVLFALGPVVPASFVFSMAVAPINQEITTDQTWYSQTISNLVTIEPGATLTIYQGSTLAFNSSGTIFVKGRLIVKGTVDNPVTIKNTNPGPTRMITVDDGGEAKLANCEIGQTGGSGGNPIPMGFNPFSNIALANTPLAAVEVDGTGKVEVEKCNIHDNAIGILFNGVYDNHIKVHRSTFDNNSFADVMNNNPVGMQPLDLRYNWWRGIDGPQQCGGGIIYSYITGNIDCSHWLTRPDFHDPVIIVPGIIGSWPEKGVLKIDPILHTYDNLYNELLANGYRTDVDLFTFPYEWRDSNAINADLLGKKINELSSITGKVDIVAHSMGGLVARAYIESSDYKDDVDQLITIATPQDGSPQSYLTWEGGEFGTGAADAFLKQVFEQEAREMHTQDLYQYIHERPVASIQQLLPIFDYLYDKNNNNELRSYPSGYPANSFLENLNQNDNTAKLNGIEFDEIVGDLQNNNSTIAGFNVVPSNDGEGKWADGYPDGYGNIFTRDGGLVKGYGDQVVPIDSADGNNVSPDKTIEVAAAHNDLPTSAQQDVLQFLTGIRPGSTKTDWQMPNLLLFAAYSPINIQIVASDGSWSGENFTGLDESKKISNSYYTGPDATSEFIAIPNPQDGQYKINTQGTGNGGSYTVKTTKITQTGDNGDAQELNASTEGTALPGQISQAIVDVQTDAIIVTQTKDTVAPITTATVSDESVKQYYNSDVEVVLSATDSSQDASVAPSGIESISYSIDDGAIIAVPADGNPLTAATTVKVTGDGNHKLSFYSTDKAGNIEDSQAITFIIDTIPPTITGTSSIVANANGWYKGDVTVHFTASDDGSGINTVTSDKVVSTEGANQSVTGIATDKAGNSTNFTVSGINIDKTKPIIVVTENPVPNTTSWNNTDVAVNFQCSDVLSGIVANTIIGQTLVSEGKNQTVTSTGTCADKAGNIADAATVTGINIDKTAPEFQFKFDQIAKDLVFTGSDNLSGIGGKTDQSGSVAVTDLAGNNTQLNFNEKNRVQSLRAQITGISYNGKAVDITGNQLAFAWFYGYTPSLPLSLSGLLSLPTVPASLPKSNTLTFLLQQARLKDGSFIVALYGGKNTMVLEYKNKKLNLQTLSGLKLIDFATNKGSFGWTLEK